MKIKSVHIHNFRSIHDLKISLSDYSIMVGKNNVGKSNIVDAIRCFYGDVKYEESDVCKRRKDNDMDPWIEIEYDLSASEYGRLDKKYQVERGKLRVRKDLKTGTFHGYTKQGLSTSKFYNERSAKPKILGNIIYVPAVVDVKENTKVSGASALNSLVSIILQQPYFIRKYEQEIQSALSKMNRFFAPYFTTINTEINKDIKSTGVSVNIGPRRNVSSSDMTKLILNMAVREAGADMDLEQLGTGTQRRIISSLIKTSVTQTSKATRKQIKRGIKEDLKESEEINKKVGFLPQMNLILFEEPEVSLHPEAIKDLAYDLHKFASESSQQVLATTHSSLLLSEDVADLNSVIRVEKDNHKTVAYQSALPQTDLEKIKNIVYFDRPRSDMFFADKVVLVEGPTEYKLYDYLCRRGDISREDSKHATLIETVGKWSMPYFINILNGLNIRYSVLYDLDGNPNRQDNLDVQNACTGLLDSSYGFPKDIETFCGTRKQGNHVINLIKEFDNGTIPAAKQAAVVQIYKGLLAKTK